MRKSLKTPTRRQIADVLKQEMDCIQNSFQYRDCRGRLKLDPEREHEVKCLREAIEIVEDKCPRASFLFPNRRGSVPEAGYEFANARTETYRKVWWKLLLARISGK